MKQISEKRKKVFMRWLPWIALIIMINVAAHIFSRNSNSNFGLLPAILFVIYDNFNIHHYRIDRPWFLTKKHIHESYKTVSTL